MSGFAVVVDWEERTPRSEIVGAMLSAMPHRAVDGHWLATTSHTVLGSAARFTTTRERALPQPHHDEPRGLWIVADARIDNRDEIARALGEPVPASDVALLSAAYRAWGDRLAERLIGDFAFAIWDERNRVLYAARDAFGIRPLFFARDGARLYIASEVDALRTVRSLPRTLDVRHLAEFAAGSITDATRTMFAAIRRVPAGHAIRATERHDSLRAWFTFPNEAPPRDAREDLALFRERFLQAVEDRLDADAPILTQLSGGIDSAAVAVAARVLADQRRTLPKPTLASATYPALSCDESSLIRAVRDRVRFPFVEWDGTDVTDEPAPSIPAMPWRDIQPAGAHRAYRVAHEEGMRVVLSGQGGDELLNEMGAFTDHARSGHLATLYRETLGSDLYLVASGRELFQSAIRQAVVASVPHALRRAYRVARPSRRSAPSWFGPQLRDALETGGAPDAIPAPTGASAVARHTWNWLTSATGQVYREIDEAYAARYGVQVRHPFLDRRLASLVLSIPPDRRLAAGRIKRLVRDAFTDELPPAVSQRTRVTTFEPAVVKFVAARLDSIEKIVTSRSAGIERFIDREAAVALCQRLLRAGDRAEWADCHDLWRIASIELWLRTLEHEV